MKALADLLGSPTPTGEFSPFITVATNKAYSAAASLLALGHYAYVLPGARILYHDIRYEALPNITSAKAREAARMLQTGNDELALKLAHHVLPRVIWGYIQLSPHFASSKDMYGEMFARLQSASESVMTDEIGSDFDFAGFALTLYAKTSNKADATVTQAIDKVVNWTELRTLEAGHPGMTTQRGKPIDILSGARTLYARLVKIGKQNSHSALRDKLSDRPALEADTKLFVELIVREAAASSKWRIKEETLHDLQRDFTFYREMENRFHKSRSSALNNAFGEYICGRKVSDAIAKADDTGKSYLRKKLQPQMSLLWSFIVLLCRALLEGEHDITPNDAQILGLANDVLGGGIFEGQKVFS
jgi:hypothetical protein